MLVTGKCEGLFGLFFFNFLVDFFWVGRFCGGTFLDLTNSVPKHSWFYTKQLLYQFHLQA